MWLFDQAMTAAHGVYVDVIRNLNSMHFFDVRNILSIASPKAHAFQLDTWSTLGFTMVYPSYLMQPLRWIFLFLLALCSLSCSVVFISAQATSANTGTRDFTDRPSFEAVIAGPSKTIGFGQILRGRYRLATLNPSIVGGITFSTVAGVSVDVAAANFYPAAIYRDDFIVNSPNDRPDNKLTITLACPTLGVGLDFGGLGLKGASSATILLSNGHAYSQKTLPAVGHTTFAGFVSSDPITSLTLNVENDSWVVLDVVTADCTSSPNVTAPALKPLPPELPIRNRVTITPTIPPGSGKEIMTNTCILGTYAAEGSLRSTPLLTFLSKKPPLFFLTALDQNGNWVPWNIRFQTDSTFPNLATIPLRTAQSTFTMNISQDGILTIKESGSSDSLIPGSGMSQLSGRETWGATETIDLKSEKDTLSFEADLHAQYTGGGGPGTGIPPGVATTCKISSHYSGEYESVDLVVPERNACGPGNLLPKSVSTNLCGDPQLPFNYMQNTSFHQYQDSTAVCNKDQSSGCTLDKVFSVFIRTPAAIAPVVSTVQPADIVSCNVIQLISCYPYDNKIRIVIDTANHSVTNYTLPEHIFYPGQVTRQIKEDQGTVTINTIGIGVGCYQLVNKEGGLCKIWPDADQQLRIAVWKELGLGSPPEISPLFSLCRFVMLVGQTACSVL